MEKRRPYKMSERAKSQAETRQKIIEATMHLHEEIGPKNTSISAIAERAGVQRLTVYRHFPDETAVFQACTSHWLSLNPPPDPAGWEQIEDPIAKFRTATGAFYDYYSRTWKMWAVSFRDVSEVPALQQPMADVAAFIDSISRNLIAAFGDKDGKDLLAPTIRHVLHFQTWSNLQDQGLSNEEKLDLVTSWLT
ncbi:TetR/AcrR family transcriptional regulator [Roseibium sp.]|uniref:TetR/AcrR family transcriptional regulator n=1 Tax=Roseibium sp. TaxID=1936156 RepID=UPI003D09A5AC